METPPPQTESTKPTDADIAAFEQQLGRPPRGLRAIAHRCPCGNPDVVETQPRLEDGTPFPTTYYLTCPRAASAIGTLEANGVMKEMTARLGTDPELREAYRAAHEDYITRRDAIEVLEGFPSAGGMPDRVKCLHVLVGHSRWPPGPGSARWAARPSRCCPSGGPRGPLRRAVRADGRGRRVDGRRGGRGPLRLPPAGRPRRREGRVTRVAAVDCGTSSIRLLVADVARHRLLHRAGPADDDRPPRPGRRPDRPARPEALERTFAACRAYAAAIEELGAERIRFVATSASRDAENSAEFVAGVRHPGRRARGDHRRPGGPALLRQGPPRNWPAATI